jgi:hypothetical protein
MPIEKEETPRSMGRRTATQSSPWVRQEERQRSPGHRFYETLYELSRQADFDRQVEAWCASLLASDHRPGSGSTAPGTAFRMHLIGDFAGIEAWSCGAGGAMGPRAGGPNACGAPGRRGCTLEFTRCSASPAANAPIPHFARVGDRFRLPFPSKCSPQRKAKRSAGC